MAEAQSPAATYRTEQHEDETRYVCLVVDAGEASGHCDHWTRSEDLMRQHQDHRHAGQMIAEEAPREQIPEPATAASRRGQSQATAAAASEPKKE